VKAEQNEVVEVVAMFLDVLGSCLGGDLLD
jgi:hypothetical protein